MNITHNTEQTHLDAVVEVEFPEIDSLPHSKLLLE